MYYSKEELEKLSKQGEEYLKKKEEKARGYKYESENGIQIICIHCKHEFFL